MPKHQCRKSPLSGPSPHVTSRSAMRDEADISQTNLNVCFALANSYLLMHHLAPHVISSVYGRVVNVPSECGASLIVVVGPTAYDVAKAAVYALTVAAARSFHELSRATRRARVGCARRWAVVVQAGLQKKARTQPSDPRLCLIDHHCGTVAIRLNGSKFHLS
jgi:NAD(P)-dependent dehydrogenase (short-subunit alcohol dehydrogenase family)